jgi:hypothetical protein
MAMDVGTFTKIIYDNLEKASLHKLAQNKLLLILSDLLDNGPKSPKRIDPDVISKETGVPTTALNLETLFDYLKPGVEVKLEKGDNKVEKVNIPFDNIEAFDPDKIIAQTDILFEQNMQKEAIESMAHSIAEDEDVRAAFEQEREAMLTIIRYLIQQLEQRS